MADDWCEKLKRRLGFDDFYPWQWEAIDGLLNGPGRALVVAPSGGGKSLCYWFPATELAGLTVVVSPLIALMSDQVTTLRARGVSATYLASTLEENVQAERWKAIQNGQVQLLYLTPERLLKEETLGRLDRLEVSLIAIDEAHCICQWGHDFRPDYLRLARVIDRLQPPHIIACTATATSQARAEILSRLGLTAENTRIVMCGFARPELHLSVERISSDLIPRERIDDFLRLHLGSRERPTGAGLIYTITRHEAESYARWLKQAGWRCAAYHAGMSPEERDQVLSGYMSGEFDVVSATSAFGMGIDRSDIRAVVHARAPGSLESYYQEIGRAGRDGQDAHILLLTSPSDLGLRKRLIDYTEESRPPRETLDPESQTVRAWRLFTEVMAYVEAGSCRHDYILRYFDDEAEALGGCGHCDICMSLDEAIPSPQNPAELAETRVLIQKALSAVARARRQVGLRDVANMLVGHETSMLKKLGLTELSTFGLFTTQSQAWALALLRRLVAAGLVNVSANESPVPYLTPRGIEVMKGEVESRILLPGDVSPPTSRRRKAPPAAPKSEEARRLYDALKRCRWDLARSIETPAYRICPDRTLVEIAESRPRNMGELERIYGMGPARIEAWGEAFLSVVHDGESPTPSSEELNSAGPTFVRP